MATILEQLAKAIEDSDATRYRISKDTGINQSVLLRIVKGTGGCNLETLDKLCEYLDLELRPVKTGRKPIKKKR
jgi:DNA-binding Xre family transcriptional regulator